MKYLNYFTNTIFILAIGFTLFFNFVSYDRLEKIPYLNQNGFNFQQGSWEEVKALAIKENKPIFIDFYAKWCGPCKMLKSVTFTNRSAGAFFNKEFINYSIDVDTPGGRLLANQYGVSSYPTLLFLNPHTQEVQREIGFILPFRLVSKGEGLLSELKDLD